MYLYTRELKQKQPGKRHRVTSSWFNSKQLVNKKFLPGNFDASKETKFIVHGFVDNLSYGKWISRMKDELLINGDYNVFLIDWSEGNGLPYSQAAANSRLVGAQIALLIENLNIAHQLNYSKCHIIGHSLGGHVAGYAGQKIASLSTKQQQNKLGRITGLDPAQPFFENMPNSVRLDTSDAQFVDVIHTDANPFLTKGGLGISQAIGHVDFFPNGGSDQPGCTQDKITSFINGGFVEGTRQLVACNHLRVIEYFIESINPDKPGNNNGCKYTGYSCESWQRFATGKGCDGCGRTGRLCAPLGYHSIDWFRGRSNTKNFYLRTGGEQPFCGFQYKISIPIQGLYNNSKSHLTGQMSLRLPSETDFTDVSPDVMDIHSGLTYYTVFSVKDNQDLSTNDAVIEFKWAEKATFNLLDHNTWWGVDSLLKQTGLDINLNSGVLGTSTDDKDGGSGGSGDTDSLIVDANKNSAFLIDYIIVKSLHSGKRYRFCRKLNDDKRQPIYAYTTVKFLAKC